MLTVYGSAMCPNCHEMRTCFDAEGIAYRFVDINETLKILCPHFWRCGTIVRHLTRPKRMGKSAFQRL